MKAWILWLTAGVLFFGVEMLVPTEFFFACLGAAALISTVIALTPAPWWGPWLGFLISSIAAVLLVRPLAKRLHRGPPLPSNVDELIGRQAVVTEKIDSHQGSGEVKVGSEIWRASATQTVGKDGRVRILRVEGTHLVVEPEGEK